MNRNEAYQACNKVMLSCPNYVPTEANSVTYLLVQIADQKEAVAIATHLINPAIPEEGTIQMFVDLKLDQQIAIVALSQVSELIKRIHKKLELLQKLSDDGSKGSKTAIKQLIKLLANLKDSEPKTEDL